MGAQAAPIYTSYQEHTRQHRGQKGKTYSRLSKSSKAEWSHTKPSEYEVFILFLSTIFNTPNSLLALGMYAGQFDWPVAVSTSRFSCATN